MDKALDFDSLGSFVVDNFNSKVVAFEEDMIEDCKKDTFDMDIEDAYYLPYSVPFVLDRTFEDSSLEDLVVLDSFYS